MHERVITVSWTTRNVSFGPRVVFQKFFDEPWACGEEKRELIESAREFPKDFRPASPGGVAPEVRRRIAAQVTPYVSKCFKLRGCYTREPLINSSLSFLHVVRETRAHIHEGRH
jgi:hypothetical protein